MAETAPNHYSHSFALNLEKLPTKKSDRIALRILYPGIIFGLILVFLGVFELFNGFNHSKTDFDFMPESEDVIYQPFMSPTFFDIVIILIGLGIVLSLVFSYIRYKKIFFDGQKIQIIYRPVWGAKKAIKSSASMPCCATTRNPKVSTNSRAKSSWLINASSGFLRLAL